MIKIDPGGIGFTSGFSREHKYSTMCEQITVEESTELSIVMTIPRYSHNYAQLCQLLKSISILRWVNKLLNSNLFTHRNTYAILREPLVKPMVPGSISYHIKLSIYFYLHLYFSNLYHKIPKIYLSYYIISI